MNILNNILKIIDCINEWIGKIFYPFILLIAIVVLSEIISRHFFSSPLIWSYETTQFLFIICTFLAAGHIHKMDGHINVDIVTSNVSKKTKIILDLITFPFFVLFIGSMVYYGYQFSVESLLKFETTGSAWDPPIFPLKFMIPIGSFLLFLQGCAKIIREIQEYNSDKNSRP